MNNIVIIAQLNCLKLHWLTSADKLEADKADFRSLGWKILKVVNKDG